MRTKYRVLTSRELSGYELRKIRGYLGMSVDREAKMAVIGNFLDCRCSLTMRQGDGFDGVLRCDAGGGSMREYTVVV